MSSNGTSDPDRSDSELPGFAFSSRTILKKCLILVPTISRESRRFCVPIATSGPRFVSLEIWKTPPPLTPWSPEEARFLGSRDMDCALRRSPNWQTSETQRRFRKRTYCWLISECLINVDQACGLIFRLAGCNAASKTDIECSGPNRKRLWPERAQERWCLRTLKWWSNLNTQLRGVGTNDTFFQEWHYWFLGQCFWVLQRPIF